MSLPRRIRNRWYWRQYKPFWAIIDYGKLTITQYKVQSDVRFRLELPIKVEYKSGNARYKTQINKRTILLYVYHSGKGIDRSPYVLSVGNVVGGEALEPGETKSVNYTFECNLNAQPFIGKRVLCKVKNQVEGYIYTGQVGIRGNYKRIGKGEFCTDVD